MYHRTKSRYSSNRFVCTQLCTESGGSILKMAPDELLRESASSQHEFVESMGVLGLIMV